MNRPLALQSPHFQTGPSHAAVWAASADFLPFFFYVAYLDAPHACQDSISGTQPFFWEKNKLKMMLRNLEG